MPKPQKKAAETSLLSLQFNMQAHVLLFDHSICAWVSVRTSLLLFSHYKCPGGTQCILFRTKQTRSWNMPGPIKLITWWNELDTFNIRRRRKIVAVNRLRLCMRNYLRRKVPSNSENLAFLAYSKYYTPFL